MVNPYHLQLPLMFLLLGFPLYMEIGALKLGVEGGESKVRCIQKEKQALLTFKKGLESPYSPWNSSSEDCCAWNWVGCDNITNHVIRLDTHDLFHQSFDQFCDGGVISPSLLDLPHLSYLDLSFNEFKQTPIPEFFGSLRKLRYLNLSNSCFDGKIHSQLGNLSNLEYLDLNTYSTFDLEFSTDSTSFYVENLDWLSGLSSLRFLDLSGTNLSGRSGRLDLFRQISGLSSLTNLRLANCELGEISSSIPHANVTSLHLLDLSYNHLVCPSLKVLQNMTSLVHLDLSCNYGLNCFIPRVFRNMVSITHLDLSHNQLQGPLPDSLGNNTSLSFLDLSDNNIQGGGIPRNFGLLCNLKSLLLGGRNKVGGTISAGFWSGCKKSSLEILDLSGNNLSGDFLHDLGTFSFLKELRLSGNQMNGTLPESMGQLSELVELDISSNSLEGVISETHFSRLSKLKRIDISSNSFILDLGFNWTPPFQLDYINMRSSQLGPVFPAWLQTWLQTQKEIFHLDISNCKILDRIPNWFWNISSNIGYMNLSSNHIYGELPSSLVYTWSSIIDLSSNHLTGSLPRIPKGYDLNLARNFFSGSLSNMLCNVDFDNSFGYLDLSHNLLSGSIPDCLMNWKVLFVLNLAYNNLSGEIPSSIGRMYYLRSLHLNNNNFSGQLPLSLKNCTKLSTLDVGENKLSGKIPLWIGESLPYLRIFRLHGNQFDKNIPSQVCQLARLQFLDLAENKLTGSIPHCLGNLSTMASTIPMGSRDIDYAYGRVKRSSHPDNTMVGWKERDMEFKENLGLLKVIDLSDNRLSGKIPTQVMDLLGLQSLNLSRNNLRGLIPNNIGQMGSLEVLDFSSNHLSGVIPEGLSKLNSLSVLNLSYNILSGKIPTGPQLQTFDPSRFAGNPELCGPPLSVNCTRSEPPSEQEAPVRLDVSGLDIPWFYIGLGTGYIVGFWAVCLSLIFKRSWRVACFRLVDDFQDWMYVVIWVNARKMRGFCWRT